REALLGFGARMPRFERSKLAAGTDAEQLLALRGIFVRGEQRVCGVLVGARELLARRIGERKLRAQARGFEAGDRLVEESVRAQPVVLDQRDIGKGQQR